MYTDLYDLSDLFLLYHIRLGIALHFHYFFFNDKATTEIYTLSLHDALPISFSAGTTPGAFEPGSGQSFESMQPLSPGNAALDRKSTRLNSSHMSISYAVFCLKKKKKKDANLPYILYFLCPSK